jgi:type I restriction enzyme, S subunit
MSLKPYPNYKDSGVEWLGKVPEHWTTLKLKRIVSLQSGDFITAENIEDSGLFPVYGGNGLRGYSSKFTHDGYYALIGRQGALCGNINYATGRFWASEHAVVASPKQESDTIWLGEMLRSMNLNQYSLSAAQPGLSVELISNLGVPLPPLREQLAIGAFLKSETAKIDALIAEQEKLIALLAEKRQAAISHAVTKGLNPNAKMKESGVEWLGKVPEHWELKELRRCILEHRQGYYSGEEYGDDGVRLARITDIKSQGQIDFSDCPRVTYKAEVAPFLLEIGDFLFARTGGAGSFALVSELTEPAIYASYLIRFRFSSSAYPSFLARYFSTDGFQSELKKNIHGGVNQNLHAEDIKEQWIALPPVQEQSLIVEFLRPLASRFDTLTAEARRVIDLLKERRTALISAAVTGKIDVRGVVEPEQAAA